MDRLLPALPVTSGPKAHFFGYYDKCPWNADGRYMLGHEIGFCDRDPRPGEAVTVGLIDTERENRFQPLDETKAWSWQQGTMLQWLGSAPDRLMVYNSLDRDHYTATIRDIHSGETRTLPRPIYALSADGRQAVTLDFDRLNRLRPGYGYMAIPERFHDVPAPEEAGIYHMDVASGESRLIVPIAWAAANQPDERFPNAHHWFNHLQFNPSASRFIFLHRWKSPDRPSWWTRLYTARPDGSDVRLHFDDGMTSHFDWRDDRTILAWARVEGRGDHFYRLDIETNEATLVGPDILTRDGHCSYSPDRRWILNDTYPDADRLQTLMLYDPERNRRINIGRFLEPPRFQGSYRCDLHPRWNRDGTQVCFDSTHQGTMRQMYVADVSSITRG